MKAQYTLLFYFLALYSYTQTKLDTLLNNLNTARHDTAVYNAYMGLGDYFQYLNPDTAIYFHTKAEKVAEKIPGAEGELRKGEAIRQKGWDNYVLSDYIHALDLSETAVKIAEKYMNNKEISRIDRLKAKSLWGISVGNIGVVYSEQGNYAKVLEYYFKALKIYEEIDNKQGQAVIFGNIGIVYYEQGNYAKALEYYFKALQISEEIGDKRSHVLNLGNIGIVYDEQGNSIKALEYYFKALKINEEIGNKPTQAANLGNIGAVYKDQGNCAKALEYFFKALQISEEIGDKRRQAINLGNIGSTFIMLKQFSKAKEYLKQAEQFNRELGTIYYLEGDCNNLSNLYELSGQYKDALYYYKEYAKAHDSLNSEQNRKALQTMELKYQYEKEQAIKEAKHQKQLEIQRKEKERQKVISYAIGSGLILVLAFSLIIFNRLHITRKQKQIIEEQKQQVETQKKLVEEKNKEITDSIVYAKRIQDAILPSESKWQTLLPDSFIFYLPKDIVAGDFYWLEETDDYIFVAAADSTGHGVPGAMVSVVCSNALSKSVLEERIYETDKILNRTKEIVTEKLSASEKHIQDGMDVALVRISKKNRRQIQFSGANRPMILITSSGMEEIQGDKQPVGLYDSQESFTAKKLELNECEEIFLFTDGIADQFGGEKGKKMGSKRFKDFLQQIASLSCVEQKEKLRAYYFEWKQKEEQTDDVTVMGIKG
ncbi:MAG: hypothetical protein Fur0023_18340 [Bacteroidia bacterium]